MKLKIGGKVIKTIRIFINSKHLAINLAVIMAIGLFFGQLCEAREWQEILHSVGYGDNIVINSQDHIFVNEVNTYFVEGEIIYEVTLLRSTDYGETWENIYSFDDASDYDVKLGIDGNDNIYLFLVNDLSQIIIHYSLDNGNSWNIEYTLIIGSLRSAHVSPSGCIFMVGLEEIPAPWGTFRSCDFGQTWDFYPENHFLGDYTSSSPSNPSELWNIGQNKENEHGLFQSTDNGVSWALKVEIDYDHYVRFRGIHCNSLGEVFVYSDSNIYIYNGVDLTPLLPDNQMWYVQSATTNSNDDLIISKYFDVALISSDYGSNWIQLAEDPPPPDDDIFFRKMVVDSNDEVYGLESEIWKTTDDANGIYFSSFDAIKPIQAIEDCNTLVAGKPTVIKLKIRNTFEDPKHISIRVLLDDVEIAQESSIEILPSTLGYNTIYFPGGPSKALPDAWGDEYDVIYFSPEDNSKLLSVELNYNDEIIQTIDYGSISVINTANAFDINYYSWTLHDICLYDPAEVSPADCIQMAENSTNFAASTFPLPYINYNVTTSPTSGDPYGPIHVIFADLLRLSQLRYFTKSDVAVGIVTSDYWRFGYPTFICPLKGISVSNIPGAAIVEEGYWTTVANRIHQLYDGWRKNDIEARLSPPAIDANGFWISERKIITGLQNNPNGACLMGSPQYRSFVYEDFEQDIWICNQGYNPQNTVGCYDHLLDVFSTGSRRSESGNAIYVSGIIHNDDQVDLDCMWMQDSAPIDLESDGDYSIKLLDQSDAIIQETAFDITFEFRLDDENTIILDSTCFGISITYPEEGEIQPSKIQMLHNDIVLAEKIVSANAPVLDITYPDGGEVISAGTTQEITWTSNDPDSDPLTYFIMLSDNSGEDWQVLLSESSDPQFFWQIPSSTDGNEFLIKVIASDGVNTTADSSYSTFTIEALYECGDLNDDTEIDILDIVFLINYKYKDGAVPDPLESADVNHDTNIDILDIVHLINFKYKGGAAPDCP
ncbi:MAG: hypothetical protein GY865_02655 [candidate division Zixibacteria bacterium]|nr:hypothetical protein [candidate division Zixibacteria bacterium]